MYDTILESKYDLKALGKSDFSGLHTLYKSRGTIKKEISVTPCFAGVLKTSPLVMSNEYHIFIRKDGHVLSNTCFFNRATILDHIKYMEYFIGDAVKCVGLTDVIKQPKDLKESSDKAIPCYDLYLDVEGPHIYHTFLLTWVRYLYEINYSLALYDTLRLQAKDKKYATTNRFNLFSMIMASTRCGTSNDMSHFGGGYRFHAFMKKTEIKAALEAGVKKSEGENGLWRITNIFPIITLSDADNNPYDLWRETNYNKSSTKNYGTLFITDPKFEEDRDKIYAHNFEILKKNDFKDKDLSKEEYYSRY